MTPDQRQVRLEAAQRKLDECGTYVVDIATQITSMANAARAKIEETKKQVSRLLREEEPEADA